MVLMTDADLQNKGVAAQGARTKVSRASPSSLAWYPLNRGLMVQFLKVFYNVREKEGIAHPPGQEEYAPGATSKEDK
jgi:hypothetical protein